jgi:hypothetical protein
MHDQRAVLRPAIPTPERIRIFFDLLNEFLIRKPQAGFDDQSSQRHAKWLRWSTKPLAELGYIFIFQFVPRDQLGQLDPAIVA